MGKSVLFCEERVTGGVGFPTLTIRINAMANKKDQKKHTHKIMRSGPVWKCILDGCRFFVYHTQDYILPGRKTICWECGIEFILTRETLSMDSNPLCQSCANPVYDDIADFIDLTERKKLGLTDSD